MYAAERHREIVAAVRQHDRVTVQELAGRLSVTPETIRRDLSELEQRGLLRRTHGGAVRVERTSYVSPVTDAERQNLNAAEKTAIAREALAHVEDDSTIAIDAGTSTIKLAELIGPERRLTVVTYSLVVATVLAGHPHVSVHLLGGRVVANSRSAVGPWTEELVDRVTLDTAFLSVDGVNVRHGITTHNIDEASIKAKLMKAARSTVVLADSTKFGREEFGRIAALSEVDTILTNEGVDLDHVHDVRESGANVTIVPV
ncbi:DeoR/GlpR transcriptional regulator [Aeromicrobium camelliae]|uniref:Lactose phosphotransferase system repressor n=2 Tax=Aeromicrobium camelliae TaxID=1538144 RepID=A0A3N6WW95_9ACTN|nr:DeoR/GlpR family DNA-binding transcription regulator [Aeromicrobium camelliae]RQN09272.1 DeoR/GlpR transcriptional regulator [Aeromicrobium camelliae]